MELGKKTLTWNQSQKYACIDQGNIVQGITNGYIMSLD